jgi:diguanylate cyclase (GGDEF)-like protein/PAS domain S-box-containing protein
MWTHADAALDSMGDAVLCTDEAARVAYLNHAAEKLTGWARAVAAGRPVRDVLRIMNGDTRQPLPDPVGLAVERDETVELAPNCALIQRDGREVPIEGSAAPIHDGHGLVVGTVVTVRNVGAALEKSRELLHQARHDALTRLPNRALLNDSLATAIAFARRHRKALAVGFLDVDGLKAINDAHGHGAGDRVLSGVASRIRATLRQSDSVGRVGGDEFVIVLSEIAHAEDTALVGEKLLQVIAAPYRVAGREVTVTASLGLALYPEDGVTAENLVANADAAMYAAKRNGPGEYRLFQTSMAFPSRERLESVQRRHRRVARSASGSGADA